MTNKDNQTAKYNELIKLSIKQISEWKKGSFERKALQIENCKKDIQFFKLMKSRL